VGVGHKEEIVKDKALYIIIGVLIGIVVMQWNQGPQTAQAQTPGEILGYQVAVEYNDGNHFVLLPNGDVYMQRNDLGDGFDRPAKYMGNFWTGEPVPASGQ
jgi:hypothetical protein